MVSGLIPWARIITWREKRADRATSPEPRVKASNAILDVALQNYLFTFFPCKQDW